MGFSEALVPLSVRTTRQISVVICPKGTRVLGDLGGFLFSSPVPQRFHPGVACAPKSCWLVQ